MRSRLPLKTDKTPGRGASRCPESLGAAATTDAGDMSVRPAEAAAILARMSTESDRIPARATLDGIEDKWAQRWSKERVVQV
jgi:hypothetical protein